MNESIRIVLHQYKNGSITEDEAVTLIKNLLPTVNTSPVKEPNPWWRTPWELQQVWV